MPPAIPFIVAAASVAGAAVSIEQSISQGNQAKKAANDASNQQAAAIANLQTAQNTASTQAQNALTAKRQAAIGSSDVYTSPLGLQTQASTARKTLLGQ